ncbi:hypothetical protein BN903_66 [Halorubrum sp. AJ67]|nr:hypothetical protein BN903_66 [Halorubrum sp. AJ67]
MIRLRGRGRLVRVESRRSRAPIRSAWNSKSYVERLFHPVRRLAFRSSRVRSGGRRGDR